MNDSGFVDHCLELLSALGPTRAHRMFGGHAIYVDELCLALVFRDALYLKVDDANRAAFEAAHCQPFVYETRNGDHGSLNYYTAPEEAMESPHEMIPWARRALAAAVAARAKAPPKKKKAAPTKVSARKVVASKVAAQAPVPKKAVTRRTPDTATRQVAVSKPKPATKAAPEPAAATPRPRPATRARSKP